MDEWTCPVNLTCPELGRKAYGQDTSNPAAASLQREKGCILEESQAHRPGILSGQDEHLCRATPCLLKKQ